MYYNNELKEVHLEISSKCNASCLNCPRYISGGGPLSPSFTQTELTLNDIKSFFPDETIKNLETLRLCGNYGDPILASEVLEILHYFKDRNPGVEIALHTNGGVRDKNFWKELGTILNDSNKMCVFSIDGLEDTNHIYRKNVEWKRLYENINVFLSAGGHAWWEYLIFEHNEHQIDEAKDLSEKIGFKNFILKKPIGFTFFKEGNRSVGKMASYNKKGVRDYIVKTSTKEEYINRTVENIILPENIVNQVFPPNINPKIRTIKSFYDRNDIIMKDYKLPKKIADQIIDLSITCYAEVRKSIYISASGLVLPCCWTGVVNENYIMEPGQMQLKKLLTHVDLEQLNIKKKSLSQILSHKFFQKTLPESWGDGGPCGKLSVCSYICGSRKSQQLKNLYVGSSDE